MLAIVERLEENRYSARVYCRSTRRLVAVFDGTPAFLANRAGWLGLDLGLVPHRALDAITGEEPPGGDAEGPREADHGIGGDADESLTADDPGDSALLNTAALR